MSSPEFEARLAKLESEMAQLKQKLLSSEPQTPWWEQNLGTFANDPMYDEAMRLGQEYRQSLTSANQLPLES